MKTILLGCLLLVVTACGDTTKTYTPIDSDAVILAFGDSLTYGTGTDKNSGYPAVLERLTGHRVINEGMAGELSQEGLTRLPELLDKYQPQLLVLIHGGNDILKKVPPAKTSANLKQMIALAKSMDIKVVMAGVPRFSIFSLESAPIYEQIALQEGIPVNLDILPEILSSNHLRSDQVHPNRQGYQMLAEAVYQLLIDSGIINPSSQAN